MNPNIFGGQWIHSQKNSSGKLNRTCSNKENVTFQWLPRHFFLFYSGVLTSLDKASHLVQDYSNFNLHWNIFDCQIQSLFSKTKIFWPWYVFWFLVSFFPFSLFFFFVLWAGQLFWLQLFMLLKMVIKDSQLSYWFTAERSCSLPSIKWFIHSLSHDAIMSV